MATPFFSVVIPMYNVENYIEATIRSVLCQTFNDYEVIVVNDGSSDSSAQIVSSIKDDRIILVNQYNEGVSSARNTGIRHARGSYIAWLDSDDIWHPQYLEMAYQAFALNPDINWYASNYAVVSGINDVNVQQQLTSSLELLSYYSKRPGFVSSSSNIMKKCALPDYELFPVGMSYAEDGCAWSYFATHNKKLIYNNTITSYYVQRKTSAIHNLDKEKELKYLRQEIDFYKNLFLTCNSNYASKLYQIHYIILKSIRLKELTSNSNVWSGIYRFVTAFFHRLIFRMK